MPAANKEVPNLDKLVSIFGEPGFAVSRQPVSSLGFAGRLRTTRQQIRERCPPGPGVYAMVNTEGHVNYIGMSKSLSKRLQSYFTRQRSRRKESAIRRSACVVIWQSIDHELLAKLRERELIRRFRPVWNVQGHPTQLKTGYIIETQQSAPSFRLVSSIPSRHGGVWGPIPVHRRSFSAVEQLNIHCGLRDCPNSTPMQFADAPVNEALAPACLRADLLTCLRPCLGGCSQLEYASAVNKGRDFLSGKSIEITREVHGQMVAAAGAKQFEIAAKLRDRLTGLQYLYERLRRFHDWAASANFVYVCQSELTSAELWIVVIRGIVSTVVPRPVSPEDKQSVRSRLEDAQLKAEGDCEDISVAKPGEFEAARLLYRWFRKHPDEVPKQLRYKKVIQKCRQSQSRAS